MPFVWLPARERVESLNLRVVRCPPADSFAQQRAGADGVPASAGRGPGPRRGSARRVRGGEGAAARDDERRGDDGRRAEDAAALRYRCVPVVQILHNSCHVTTSLSMLRRFDVLTRVSWLADMQGWRRPRRLAPPEPAPPCSVRPTCRRRSFGCCLPPFVVVQTDVWKSSW